MMHRIRQIQLRITELLTSQMNLERLPAAIEKLDSMIDDLKSVRDQYEEVYAEQVGEMVLYNRQQSPTARKSEIEYRKTKLKTYGR